MIKKLYNKKGGEKEKAYIISLNSKKLMKLCVTIVQEGEDIHAGKVFRVWVVLMMIMKVKVDQFVLPSQISSILQHGMEKRERFYSQNSAKVLMLLFSL